MGWTNNWTAMKNALLCGCFRSGISTMTNMTGNVIETGLDNTDVRVAVPSPMSAFNVDISASARTGPGGGGANFTVLFGDGNAAPSVTDYSLDSRLTNINRLSTVHESVSVDTGTSTVTRTEKVTVQNVGAASITIREWGIVLDGASGFLSANDFLIYRALLDSPVTLDVNQAATLTLTLSVTLDDPV